MTSMWRRNERLRPRRRHQKKMTSAGTRLGADWLVRRRAGPEGLLGGFGFGHRKSEFDQVYVPYFIAFLLIICSPDIYIIGVIVVSSHAEFFMCCYRIFSCIFVGLLSQFCLSLLS